MLKIKTRGNEIKDLKYRTEKHDYENILKSFKKDDEQYKKKYKSIIKKKVFMIVSEISIGSAGLVVGSGSTISGIALVGIMTATIISFLSSISTVIKNEYFSKSKIRYTKLRDWIIVNIFLYENTSKTCMIDKKIGEREAEELKKI